MTTATVFLALAAGVAGLLAWACVHRVTVFEYQHALRFDRGRLTGVLEPGVYWILQPVTVIQLIDARPRSVTIPGQELLSADGVTIKVSLLLEVAVTDPARAVLDSADHDQFLYATAQAALRTAVGERDMETLLRTRGELAESIRAAVAPGVGKLGLDLRSLSVKDIMFPGALKEAFSQTARARQEAQAALERARGESAALRHLANAARMLDDNPSLYQLRLVQAAADGGRLHLRVEVPESRADAADGSRPAT